jgi:uncharacterized protein (TIGR04255 family)
MPFPPARRLKYRRNPLDRVVCQLRYPPILKIDLEVPADFQDRVRQEFPNYVEKTELRLDFPSKPVPQETLAQLVQSAATKNYEFLSEDRSWQINLTRNFIALSTNSYIRWEHFRDKLQLPLQALTNVYTPLHISRVGLRYVDVIKRSRFNLEDVPWNELLKPHILGLTGAPEVAASVKSFETRHDVNLRDDLGSVRIVTRLVESKDNGELCYMIDSDFSNSGKRDVARALEELDQLSIRGSRLFQWCITERLHQAMEPELL